MRQSASESDEHPWPNRVLSCESKCRDEEEDEKLFVQSHVPAKISLVLALARRDLPATATKILVDLLSALNVNVLLRTRPHDVRIVVLLAV